MHRGTVQGADQPLLFPQRCSLQLEMHQSCVHRNVSAQMKGFYHQNNASETGSYDDASARFIQIYSDAVNYFLLTQSSSKNNNRQDILFWLISLLDVWQLILLTIFLFISNVFSHGGLVHSHSHKCSGSNNWNDHFCWCFGFRPWILISVHH